MQFTWDHIHYLKVRPYQNVKSIRQAFFQLPHSQAISCIGYNDKSSDCCGGHLGFLRMPKINNIRGLGSIKTILKCEVNPTSDF